MVEGDVPMLPVSGGQPDRRHGLIASANLAGALPYLERYPQLPSVEALRSEQRQDPALERSLEAANETSQGPMTPGEARFEYNNDGLLVRRFRNHRESFVREQLVLPKERA